MSTKTYTSYTKRQTPQSQPIPGEAQVPNSAGGFTYGLDPWTQLDRFLILGTEGGTYYAGEQTLTRENAQNVERCLGEDGGRAVARIVAISEAGRAASNDPALFALALAASSPNDQTRQAAWDALPKVARIPTHLFHFMAFLKGQRGFGRGARKALAHWVNSMEATKLAYEFVKYQSRDGWSSADVLRKAHVQGRTPLHDAVLRWATCGVEGLGPREVRRILKVRGGERVDLYPAVTEVPPVITAFEALKGETDARKVIAAITEHRLTREMIPTEHLTRADVWEALLAHMNAEAMIRNLGNMTRLGLLTSSSEATKLVVERLRDLERLRKARVHPLKVLNALRFYQQGGAAGARAAKDPSATYTPVRQIVDALDEAFYLSFGVVEPTGKRLILALDVSGSMGTSHVGTQAPGRKGQTGALTAREASAVLAMVTARVESDYVILGFTMAGSRKYASGTSRGSYGYGVGGDGVSELSISPRQRLDGVLKAISGLPFGGTDCALPARWALAQKDPCDGIAIYTDNETWAGDIHPSQALRQLREQSGKPVRQAVVAMTPTAFTIADPNDPLSLDVVGFDTETPGAISEFVRG